jgi:hypothetical protein
LITIPKLSLTVFCLIIVLVCLHKHSASISSVDMCAWYLCLFNLNSKFVSKAQVATHNALRLYVAAASSYWHLCKAMRPCVLLQFFIMNRNKMFCLLQFIKACAAMFIISPIVHKFIISAYWV